MMQSHFLHFISFMWLVQQPVLKEKINCCCHIFLSDARSRMALHICINTCLFKCHQHTCCPCLSCRLWGGSSGLSPWGVKHNIKHFSRENIHDKLLLIFIFGFIFYFLSHSRRTAGLYLMDSTEHRAMRCSPFRLISCCWQSKLCR